MTSRLRRRSGQAASLLFVFLLAGVGACSGGPSQSKLKGIATSDEVRQKRERTERELRARAEEIGKASPWGPALRTTVVDTCARGAGKNYFDPNPPERTAMNCLMRLHLYFVVDRPVQEVLRELGTMKTPTVWNSESIRGALRYYEEKTYESPHAYRPSIASLTGGEQLSWDVAGNSEKLKHPDPCATRPTVYSRCVSEPADVTLPDLRKRGGTLFEWTLNAGYHTVPGK
ncbi:hypothetical protein ACFT7S_18540 [Streptomyces sp. NPDC057136]|uniref:hypothetical protein n=1 Tax=Streptomyces sp. NPDC057136 TaxID=3346029 RepID=UPI003624AD9C